MVVTQYMLMLPEGKKHNIPVMASGNSATNWLQKHFVSVIKNFRKKVTSDVLSRLAVRGTYVSPSDMNITGF